MKFKKEKHLILRGLEKKGIVRQEMPVSYDYKNTEYWPYSVKDTLALPSDLREEYILLGEIRL